jgi:hypothetical protein
MVKVIKQAQKGYRQTSVIIFSQIKIYSSVAMGKKPFKAFSLYVGSKYNEIGFTRFTGALKGLEIGTANGVIYNNVKEAA